MRLLTGVATATVALMLFSAAAEAGQVTINIDHVRRVHHAGVGDEDQIQYDLSGTHAPVGQPVFIEVWMQALGVQGHTLTMVALYEAGSSPWSGNDLQIRASNAVLPAHLPLTGAMATR